MNASRGGLLNMSVAERDKHERELMYAYSWLWPKQAVGYFTQLIIEFDPVFRSKENLEREKFFASGSMSDVTPYDLLQPRSDFAMRNRYLSRIGAKVGL
jgi:hypothetical protein